MTNADKFKGIFGICATELWAKPGKEFLEWLNENVPDTNVRDMISRQAAIEAASRGCFELRGVFAVIESMINSIPSAQPEQGAIEQIKWERDLAIQQLRELGYGLGEKPRTDVDTISRQVAVDALAGFTQRSNGRTPKQIVESLPSAQPEPIKITIDHAPTPDELERLKQAMKNTPVMLLPSAQSDKRLEKIADLVEGTIDHFDRDDAMDLLYQIKEVLNER